MKNNYHIELSDKFKTNFIQVRYLVDATIENTTYTALLAMYLVYCNNATPSYKQTTDHLDSLFGSRVDVCVGLSGDHLVINFILSNVATKYIKDDSEYLGKIMNTYLDYIFNPLKINGLFSSEVFELKKYELKERIKESYDDKSSYAIEQFLEIFAKGFPLSLNSNGYLADLEKMKVQDLTLFYDELIQQTPLVNGNVIFDDYLMIEDILKTKIPETSYHQNFNWYHLNKIEVEEVIEKQDVSQSKLVVGYFFEHSLTFSDYYTGLVLNALLGMSSNSYLFRIVREKENLCYTIRSNYDLYSNSILIYAGIEKENYEMAITLIENIISDMQHGNIDIEDFNDAKTVMMDVIHKINDSQGGLVAYQSNRLLQGFNVTLKDDINSIEKVEMNDVIELIKKIKLKTKYLLSGELNGK